MYKHTLPVPPTQILQLLLATIAADPSVFEGGGWWEITALCASDHLTCRLSFVCACLFQGLSVLSENRVFHFLGWGLG